MTGTVQVRLWAPGHRARFGARVCVGILLIFLAVSGFTSALPTKPLEQSPSSASNPVCLPSSRNSGLPGPLLPTDCVSSNNNQTAVQLGMVGADPFTNLS